MLKSVGPLHAFGSQQQQHHCTALRKPPAAGWSKLKYSTSVGLKLVVSLCGVCNGRSEVESPVRGHLCVPIFGVKSSPEVESQFAMGSWPANIWKWLTRALGLRVVLSRTNFKRCFPSSCHVKSGNKDYVGQYSAHSFWKQTGSWKKKIVRGCECFWRGGCWNFAGFSVCLVFIQLWAQRQHLW